MRAAMILCGEKAWSRATHDRAVSDAGAAAVAWLEGAGSFDELLRQHVLAWEQLWARFPIELAGAEDDRVLPVLRLDVFHLLQTIGPNSVGIDADVPARGLHGEAYRGHVFWDELFVLPVLNLRLPRWADHCWNTRYYRLPAAQRLAARA